MRDCCPAPSDTDQLYSQPQKTPIRLTYADCLPVESYRWSQSQYLPRSIAVQQRCSPARMYWLRGFRDMTFGLDVNIDRVDKMPAPHTINNGIRLRVLCSDSLRGVLRLAPTHSGSFTSNKVPVQASVLMVSGVRTATVKSRRAKSTHRVSTVSSRSIVLKGADTLHS